MLKPCPRCKKEYNSSRNRRFYCSVECATEARRDTYKAQNYSLLRMIKQFERQFSEKRKLSKAAYRSMPDAKYYMKLWRCGLSVKDIKREKRS